MCAPAKSIKKSPTAMALGKALAKNSVKSGNKATPTSAPKAVGGSSKANRNPTVNLGGASTSSNTATTIKKRKSTLNVGGNTSGSSGVGANINL